MRGSVQEGQYPHMYTHNNCRKKEYRKWRERKYQRDNTRTFTRTKRHMFTDWKNPWVLNIRNEKVLHQSHIIVKFQYAGNKEKFLKASKRVGVGREEQVIYKRLTFKMV